MNKRNTLVGPQLQRGRAGFTPDWKRLMAFVAVIMLGSIVATQILANSYQFHPALGFNVFHVYPPWSYFLWSHQWEQPSNHSLFAQAFGIGSLVTLGGFMLLLMDTYAHINGQNHPVVSASARDMLDRPPNEAGSVLSTAKTFLDLYRDPTVAKNTSRSDFRIRDLMHYVDPVSLYIITQPNDKDRLRPLVRIVVNMIVRLLADKMEFENGRPKPTYKHKLLAMIDEFPALGKLEILQQSLAFVAGYGIKCYLIAQDINQLKSRETGYGPDESITSNCHIQAAFPPNRLETAEHLSKLTGTTTIIKEQVTRSGRGFLGTQVSTTMQEVQRPLLTPDECQRMPGPQKDEHDRITAAGDMVIYCAGHPAIYGRQPLYFEDKTFVARAAIPAPTHSDSLSSLPVPEVKMDIPKLQLPQN